MITSRPLFFLRLGLTPLLPLALSASGCGLFLGLDDFKDGPGGAGGSSASTSTAMNGAGASGAACTPNALEACYDGDPATKGVGQCAGGMRSCDASGVGRGPCMGQVLPGTEDCKIRGDENCDGNACSDAVAATLFGAPGNNARILDMAVDPQGNIYLAGSLSATMKLSDTITLSPSGGADFWIGKFDSSGAVVWAKRFGTPGTVGNTIGIAADKNGAVAISGAMWGTYDFGGGPLTSVSGNDNVFVAYFNAMGDHVWSVTHGINKSSRSQRTAFDANGDVIIAGENIGDLTLGGITLTNAGTGTFDGFVAKLAKGDGKVNWAKRLGESTGGPIGNQYIGGLTVDSANLIYVTGSFSGSLNFAVLSYTSKGSEDVFIAKLDDLGNAISLRGFGSVGYDHPNGITVDTGGNVVVSGKIGGDTDFGGGTVVPGAGSFVAKYDSQNKVVWGNSFVGQTQNVEIATDLGDNIYITGTMFQDIDFGGGTLKITGGTETNFDVFLAKFEPMAGKHLWSKNFGGSSDQTGVQVRYQPKSKNILMTGGVVGVVDFGTGELISNGNNVFLAEFQP
jgi:hypothetical protein